jgi:hypothetical protein
MLQVRFLSAAARHGQVRCTEAAVMRGRADPSVGAGDRAPGGCRRRLPQEIERWVPAPPALVVSAKADSVKL